MTEVYKENILHSTNMDKKNGAECPYPGCFFCVMKETNPSKRRVSVAKFFKEFPNQNEDGQVLAVSGLWNTAMAHPNDGEFVELGVFECMAALIRKGIRNREWLARDQNVYIPYYAAHIIGSYTMNMEEFAERAVRAGVIPPLIELLCGKLTWVEQRVAVRALGHLATYDATFAALAAHGEVLELAMQLAAGALEIAYTHFFQFAERRLSYHCDLLTRGMGGPDMESRKAEEWASQLQCWSLQLLNCFAFKPDLLPSICKAEFLNKLPGMWGGLVNENSPAGVGLLRTICHQKFGRISIANCPLVIEGLCNIARSSDDWQYMAIDCLLWLLQDPNTRNKVLDKAAPALVDMAELPSLGERKKLGDLITSILLQDSSTPSSRPSLTPRTKSLLQELAALQKKLKWEKEMPKEDLHIKQAAALVVKLEGNSKFSGGDIAGAAAKYTEALALCPARAKKERVVLYSNRAQCQLLLQDPWAAVSDATRALSLHRPPNRHGKSLWRRAQAYEILGLHKESLLDAIMFINECSQPDLSSTSTSASASLSASAAALKQNRVPDYAERLVKKQMQAAWLFKEAALKHGGVHHERQEELGGDENPDEDDNDDDDDGDDDDNAGSKWETASESDAAEEERRDDDASAGEDGRTPPPTQSPPVFKGITLEDLFGRYHITH